MEQKLTPLHVFTGQVVHGLGNGRTVHMPTANLPLAPGEPLPPLGVYAALVTVDGQTYVGVTNVGFRPTLGGEQAPTVETFILDFQGDLYDRPLSVALYFFLRPTRRMESLAEVQSQVEKDSLRARELLGEMTGTKL